MESLQSFKTQFLPLCKKIRYLKWMMKGDIDDFRENSKTVIEKLIIQMDQLYSLAIMLSCRVFAAKRIASVANGIKYLPNLCKVYFLYNNLTDSFSF